MVRQTNEQALEKCIERALLEGSRYEKGNPADCDRFLCHTKHIDSPLHLCVS
jgi:type I restriction enzyme R subunit